MFSQIKPSRDLINISKEKTKTINNCIDFSNRLSRWVAGEVVQTANVKKRVAVLRCLIEIASHCWKLNNFSVRFRPFHVRFVVMK